MQDDTRSADLQAYYEAMWTRAHGAIAAGKVERSQGGGWPGLTRATAWPWSPVPVRPARRASMRCSSVWRLPARAISPRS